MHTKNDTHHVASAGDYAGALCRAIAEHLEALEQLEVLPFASIPLPGCAAAGDPWQLRRLPDAPHDWQAVRSDELPDPATGVPAWRVVRFELAALGRAAEAMRAYDIAHPFPIVQPTLTIAAAGAVELRAAA